MAAAVSTRGRRWAGGAARQALEGRKGKGFLILTFSNLMKGKKIRDITSCDSALRLPEFRSTDDVLC